MGVIGGPDGPTTIYATTTPGGTAVLALLASAVIGAGIWFYLRRRKK